MSESAHRAHVRMQAQAKLNLFLHVGARETSGYHQLHTLFARLELADAVDVRVGGKHYAVECEDTDAGPADRNLALRAAEHYADACGWPRGCHIIISKHIPVGGGLGGGSADAGAVLRALNAVNPRPIAAAQLLEIGAAIGADIPYLTSDDALALGGGRGEQLLALPPLPPRVVALLVPSFAVRTADAYAWLAADRNDRASASGRASRLEVAQLASWDSLAQLAWNDFTAPVERRYPALADMRAALNVAGALFSLLSGSGSTVFGVFDETPDLRAAANALSCRVVLTRTASHVVPVHRIE